MAVQSKSKIEEQLKQAAERSKRMREAGGGLKIAKTLLDAETTPRNVTLENRPQAPLGQPKR